MKHTKTVNDLLNSPKVFIEKGGRGESFLYYNLNVNIKV